MVHESLRRLKLDQRLIRRRGWIAPEELEQELARLPDVSDKIAPPPEELEEPGAPAESGGGDQPDTP